MSKFNILEWLYEYWAPVKGYEGLYEVSNWGRVRSLDRYVNGKSGSIVFIKGRIITPIKTQCGYLKVKLCKNGTVKTISVHRIVSMSFISNPNNLPQINHRTEEKTVNSVWNLEWCTAEYNSNYGTHKEKLRTANTGRKMPRYGVEKVAEKLKKPVACFKNGVMVKLYKSAADASRENPDLNYVSISAACNGRIRTYRGLEWRFV